MAAERRRNAVIIANRADPLEALVAAAGYEVVATASMAINGEQLVRQLRPDVVVVENDLIGETGFESIPHLREASPTTQVLLIVTEDWLPVDVGSTGAFAFVTWRRLGELVNELDELDDWIRAQASAPLGEGERRTGRDRRLHQDWAKVGWERRADQRRSA